jgi:hypothetical protein
MRAVIASCLPSRHPIQTRPAASAYRLHDG